MKPMKLKRVRRIIWGLIILGAALAFTGVYTGFAFSPAMTAAGILLTVAAVVFKLVYYRCPHCNAYLDRSTGSYCPYCGKKVE